MDYQYLQQYGAALLGSLRMVRTRLREAENELALWKSRAVLASEKDRPQLQAQALAKAEEAADLLAALKGEEAGYLRELDKLKLDLQQAKIEEGLQTDYDQILAELDLMIEKPDETAGKMREFEADLALEELKRNMRKE